MNKCIVLPILLASVGSSVLLRLFRVYDVFECNMKIGEAQLLSLVLLIFRFRH